MHQYMRQQELFPRARGPPEGNLNEKRRGGEGGNY